MNQVKKGNLADGKLEIGDEIVYINNESYIASELSHKCLNDLIDNNFSLKLILIIKKYLI